MSRQNQQIVRLIQELIRLVKTGKLKVRWIIALVVLVVGYFLLQPVLERSLGVDLPGLVDVTSSNRASDHRATGTQQSDPQKNGAQKTSPHKTSPPPQTSDGVPAVGDLSKILSANSREIYQSPAGLHYTRGSQHGHRLKHLMAHARDEPDRPGQHGVFDSADPETVVALVDEAYLQAQTGRDTRTQREAERTVYDVNLRRRIGYIGGTSGNRKSRPAAKHLRLVVEGDRVITAFPVRP